MTPLHAQRVAQLHTLRQAIATLTYDRTAGAHDILADLWEALADAAMGVDMPYVEHTVTWAESLLEARAPRQVA